MNQRKEQTQIQTEEHIDWVRALTYKFMERFLVPSSHREELISIGLLGLVEAAGRFLPDRGVPFKAYAVSRVRGALLDGLSEITGLTRVSYKKIKAYRALTDCQEQERVREELKASPDAQLGSVFEFASQAAFSYKLQHVGIDGDEIIRSNEASPEEKVEQGELIELLQEQIEQLSEKERLVLKKYYFQFASFKDIGEKEGMSKGHVSKVHKKALLNLQKSLMRLTA